MARGAILVKVVKVWQRVSAGNMGNCGHDRSGDR